jgi:hypothetical protein
MEVNMICFNHHDQQAVAICKNCHKAVCEECAISDEGGIACSIKCQKENLQYHQMMEKSKLVYGLQSGRIPVATLLLLLAGFPIVILGIYELIIGQLFGIFTIAMGAIFVSIGVFSYINMKKSGISQ